jgi:hypothetical protein
MAIRLTRNVGIGSRSQEELDEEDKIERMSVTVTGTNEESAEVAELLTVQAQQVAEQMRWHHVFR